MARIIRLRSMKFKRVHNIRNPLVANAAPVTQEERTKLVKRYLDTRSKDDFDAAVMSFASLICLVTSRYIAVAPVMLAPHEDDLVSTAFETVIKTLQSIDSADNVSKVVLRRIIHDQAEYANNCLSAVKSSYKTKRRRGEVSVACDIDDIPLESLASSENEDLDAIDLLDLFDKLIPYEEYAPFTDPENFGKTSRQLAEELGVHWVTVAKWRREFLKLVKEEMYEEDC